MTEDRSGGARGPSAKNGLNGVAFRALFLGDFLLGQQKKVTRPEGGTCRQAKPLPEGRNLPAGNAVARRVKPAGWQLSRPQGNTEGRQQRSRPKGNSKRQRGA
ncbi:MAG: hypothetical protein KF863_19685 [Rubrivivax sp.]|nr:hypothetical protein [Rubrivivax sp.]